MSREGKNRRRSHEPPGSPVENTSLRIAILGTGRLGRALARLFASVGHTPLFGSRSGDGRLAPLESDLAGRFEVEVLSHTGAVAASDLVVLAVPWQGAEAAVRSAGDFGGRLLIDATNPEPEIGRGLLVGHTTSGAERIAAWACNARVVKSLNHVYAEALLEPELRARGLTVFLCGDDRAARAEAAALLASCGLDPVDAGELSVARYLEPLAALLVELVRAQGFAPASTGFHLLRDRS